MQEIENERKHVYRRLLIFLLFKFRQQSFLAPLLFKSF